MACGRATIFFPPVNDVDNVDDAGVARPGPRELERPEAYDDGVDDDDRAEEAPSSKLVVLPVTGAIRIALAGLGESEGGEVAESTCFAGAGKTKGDSCALAC